MTSLRAGRYGVRIPVGAIYVSLLQIIQTIFGANHGSNRYRVSLPAERRLACDAAHSLPYSATVKKGWSYTSTPPIYLHGVERATLHIFTVDDHRPILDMVLRKKFRMTLS
jgi:hypothetical protein